MEIKLSELRSKLTSVLELVKNGQMIEVTERGKLIARIEPVYVSDRLYPKNTTVLERTKAAQRGRDALLKGVNRKS